MWLKKPYIEQAKITSPFGERKHPISKKASFHKGVDISLAEGTKLYAPINGNLTRHIDGKGLDKGYGRYIMLWGATEQNTKVMILMAHLSKWCAENDGRVIQGNLIALSGNSGGSTGAHLHLEVRLFDGKDYVPVDPVNYINFA